MRYGELTCEEIRERAGSGCMALLPTGCTEQQGPHLPVDFDTWFVEQLCLAGSEKADHDYGVHSLVLPPIPFGPTPEHRNFGSGYIDIPKELHESLVSHVLKSLADQGFKSIVVWRGCGGHDLKAAIRGFNVAQNGKAKAYLPNLSLYHEIWCQHADGAVPGGHADSFSTSVAMYLRPESVSLQRINNPHSAEPDWADPNLDFHLYSETGVIGDPTKADRKLGERLWNAVVERVALYVAEVSKGQAPSD